jgi:signal transduction histidine kinase
LFDIVFSIIWIISLSNLFRSYKYSDGILKINMKHMFWGLTLGIIPPALANIILPTLGIYQYNWTGPIASAIWVFVIGYSIMRYRQMNVLIVITEMLAVAMTIMFFINIFVRADLGVAENILTFSVFLLVATYLIRTVLSEEKIKQQLHVLNETLEDKVREQTQDIRNALDGERLAKRELEKLNETKNQFIMITQHSIRTPLQNLKRDLGHDISKLSLRNIERLTAITDDFLSISSIESNKQILELKPHSLLPIINKVLEDFEIDISRMQLKISYDRNEQKWPKINIDHNKIYELFTIVIENAIKYNNEGGEISISSDGNEKKQTIIVSDTGLGLSQDDLKKINSNLFYRSESAKKNNPHGMGVGLSVAKMIAKAHHGAINIESDGHNMGSKITIELKNDYLQDIIDN